jgi:hypothetical protein
LPYNTFSLSSEINEHQDYGLRSWPWQASMDHKRHRIQKEASPQVGNPPTRSVTLFSDRYQYPSKNAFHHRAGRSPRHRHRHSRLRPNSLRQTRRLRIQGHRRHQWQNCDTNHHRRAEELPRVVRSSHGGLIADLRLQRNRRQHRGDWLCSFRHRLQLPTRNQHERLVWHSPKCHRQLR